MYLGFFKGFLVALLLSLAVTLIKLPEHGVAAPEANAVRLANSVTISVPGVDIDRAVLLPDNETIVVVGGKPRDPNAVEIVSDEAAPPAGAIINFKTKKVRPFTNGHTARIYSVACWADGSQIVTVASGKDPFVRLWDVKAYKTLDPVPLPKLEDGYFPSYGVACFAASHKIAVGIIGGVTLLDPAESEKKVDLAVKALSKVSPDNLVISPDDKFVACSTLDHDIVVWDVKGKKVVYSPSFLPEGGDRRRWHFNALGFTKDGARLIVAQNGPEDEIPKETAEEKVKPERRGLFLIDIAKRQVTPLGMGHQIHTSSFALDPSENWLATMGTSRPDQPDEKGLPPLVCELRVYHFPTRVLALRVQFKVEDFLPNWVGFTSDGKKIVGVDYNGKVRVWDFVVK